MTTQTPTILVLIGITGDLATHKLLPAISHLQEEKKLPDHFRLVGVSRRAGEGLFTMDLENPAEYRRLKTYLENIEKEWGTKAQWLFYLSVAPKVSLPIIEQLGTNGFDDAHILLEKPFGLDLESAKSFINTIEKYFSNEQVYRIDHYLAKNTVRGLPKVSFDDIRAIEINASEVLGVDGRESFYEQTGALRDFIQCHLLEVVAALIDPNNRVEVLKKITATGKTSRGQYVGYRELVKNPTSTVETRASVEVKYGDICITLKTGKKLDKKSTNIILTHTDGITTHISLNDSENAYENVFLDAIAGDKRYFIAPEEVIETWRIVKPIQDKWAEGTDDLEHYSQ